MNIIALIQARMSSKRLPNKVLLPLEDKAVLEHVYLRLKHCKTLSDIIVATSRDETDKPIANFCKEKKIKYFEGSLNDVLDRFYEAAKKNKADAIVRITADCPVIDPFIVDEVVVDFLRGNYDYSSLNGNFPDGLDCQVFKFKALEQCWREAKLPSDREHVGTFIEKTNPQLFNIGKYIKFKNLEDITNYRWTLDEKEDYQFLKEIFSKLYNKKKLFISSDIIQLLEMEPHLKNINRGITRNQGYLDSLKKEKI
jgi:spore coat polysaccharide biosynthesis protein SpsF